MEVSAWSENLNLSHANELGVLPMSKNDLLKTSDIVSIHVVLGEKYKNLIISRSFSKAHGLAALRLGYAVSSEEIAEFLNRVRQPFNTNSLALAAGVEAVTDKEHIAKSIEINKSGMEKIKKVFD